MSNLIAGLLLLAPLAAMGQFRSPEDRRIASDIIKTFSRECTLRGAADGDVVDQLEIQNSKAQKLANQKVQKCFQSGYSQIIAVHSIYKKVCSEVTSTPETSTDTTKARQLLDISNYQAGIRPHHSVLNDCLQGLPNREGLDYMIALTGTGLSVEELKAELDAAAVKDVFPATFVPFR
ncbi:MAG: hypothetical protein IT289_09260 [Oligoflexia bacterium]|nr:hypothetical protein [Oligoflexia bacterium]